MQTPSFRLIEDRLRDFMGRTCKCLAEVDPEIAARMKSGRASQRSFEQMELADFCRMLDSGFRYDGANRTGVLFDYFPVSNGFGGDVKYCLAMRNRYSHVRGFGVQVPAKEQLADLVVVQRLVRSILELRDTMDADHELQSIVEREIRAHLPVVAQTIMPEEFDREERVSAPAKAASPELEDLLRRLLTRAEALGAANAASSVPIPSPAELPASVLGAFESAARELRAAVEGVQRTGAQLGGAREVASSLRDEVGRLSAMVERLTALEDRPDADYEPASHEEAEAMEAATRAGPQRRLVPPKPKPVPLTEDEAREKLLLLRSRIWSETGGGPSADGLLRKRMIDDLIAHRPASLQELQESAVATAVATCARAQLRYLPEVFAVLERLPRLPSSR